MRRGDVFAGRCPAHGRLVNSNGLGDLHHSHGLEVGGAEVHEIPLLGDNLAGDVENRLLALLDASDEKIPASDFVTQVVADLLRVGGEHVFVGIRNSQAGNLVAVQGNHVVVPLALHDDFGCDDLICVLGKSPAGSGIEAGNHLGRALDFRNFQVECLGDVVEFFSPQLIQVVADNAGFDGMLAALGFELAQEAFRESAGGNAGGIELLDFF